MGASKPTPSTTIHPMLAPHVQNISQSTIHKKWKPLPPASQDKIRHILLNLRTKRSGAGGNGRIPAISKARSRTARTGNGKAATKNAIAEEEYEKVVEEVTEKLLARLPRMPFPPTSTSTTSTTADDFDLSSTLTRIATLQAQLTSTTQSAQLLRRQIDREKAALKRDKKELKSLEEGLRGSREVRKKKERGLHELARVGDPVGDESDEEEDAIAEIERINDLVGIGASSGKGMFGTSRTTAEPTLGVNDETDPELQPLLKQLQSHLLSMRNNTASMMPVLGAMDEVGIAMDTFASKSLDDEALRKLYSIAHV
ncbi:hypothetical protein H2200_001436 [Cladophialophora chaetospira]|uniref:Uncharacterized protein n=1 Tax=Cladophialophora chaetospira TaxID=386627 RepID=A0AA38XKZ5_9EURO|nr:hypothetical protein H2200_001436 [Cladophialophora chaetospira]